MGVRFSVSDSSGELGVVETETEDDFMYFRDSVHAALETGEFGSRFPTFMQRFFEGWDAGEVAALERELKELHTALRQLPASPADGNWASKLAMSGRKPETLAEVFVDRDEAPLVERMLALAKLARAKGLGINWG